MTPTASQLMRAAVSLFQTVSNQRETDKMLIIKEKMAAVSLFQRFGGTPPAKFNGDRPRFENSQGPSPENGETAKRTEIYPAISDTCPFHSGLKRPETPLRAQDG